MKKIAIISFYISFILILSYSHSGKTDANGGHWNRKTGTYHTHNGGSTNTYNGNSIKANTSYYNSTFTNEDAGKYAYVTQNANLRKGSGKKYEIIKVLLKDSSVKIIKIEGDWANVELDNSTHGWISKIFLRK
ncbi:MAG: hypothetical protein A2015_12865 [Spirochaetes bacterium GWF1_31_7]|nr:MAG: hypothetical protein A2Y30_10655 [Spirochaetes bacterium GWE1_32_154]OHD49272.1 MAG: hypothetical protein A2Y29_16285 [Spirochaetes bacterium GWE2_31_10]OHD51834.1 MAG: hypothetical protein A2015_12865 [Spirochaetes bacterium GWF1_31_7]OHD73890.1 MAG: hypothetical protein A2355_17145 [Spirochaetes bacterium RIFOXYB1_FULL_32_8]HBD95740.1 hypothetical protein [Spirochaetia bacterium]